MLQRFGHIIPNPGFDEAERKFIAIMADNEVGCPALLFSVTSFRRPMLFPTSIRSTSQCYFHQPLTLFFGILLGRIKARDTEYKELC